MKLKIISAFLAVLMLTGALSACGTAVDQPSDTLPLDQTTGAVEEQETELKADLPDDLYYNGDEITILSRYQEGGTSGEIAVEGLISEPVNDAVYERNLTVENRLGVKIISVEDHVEEFSHVATKITTLVQSGVNDFDVAVPTGATAASPSLDGMFVNLRDTAYLGFDKPWWSQGFNETAEYKGNQYMATGAMLITSYRFAFVMVFNQDLFLKRNQPFLYEYVENGTWTLDKQISLVPLFHEDNGNSKQDREGDVYGFISNHNMISVDPYWSACDVPVLGKNESDEYEVVLDLDRLHSMTEKTLQLFYETDNATYRVGHIIYDAEQADIRQMFADGYGAMATLRVMELENGAMRNMESKYGVVPMPKLNEEQESYGTVCHNIYSVVCIPTTVKEERRDEISAVLEAMAYASYTILRPAYYETTLRTKLSQDPQSARMMDIIFDNLDYDPGMLYCVALGSFHDQYRSVMASRRNNIVSLFKRYTNIMDKGVGELNNKLSDLAE